MSERVSEYNHVFSIWEVYPRVHHFQKRFNDLYERYKNITKPLQPLLVTSKLTEESERLACQLKNCLQVIVIGKNNLEPEKFVISTEPLRRDHAQDWTSSPMQDSSKKGLTEQRITIVICYAKINTSDFEGLQAVQETLKYFASREESSGTCEIVSLLIVCETSTLRQENVTEYDRFCSDIISAALKSFNMEIDADNVIINPKEYVLGSKISDILEKRVMQCFLCVRTQLQDLIRLSYRHVSADSIDILYSEQLITSIQGFLKNGLGFVDILETRKDEPFIDTVLGNLIQVIRCALIAPLSAKYGLSEDACNRLAHEFNFESRLIKSVSKTTRYHLSELEKPCEEMFKATKLGNKSHHFPGRSFVFIAYPLRKDIQAVLREFERVIYCAGRIASTMKKMLYEISGYLYRSVIKEEADMKKMQVAIPALLRESIMAIDGVFGIGTIYGQLEVHLKNMEHEREAVVQRKVCEMINNFKFTQPYRVVRVLQEPEKFCFETGYHIEYLRDVAFHLSGTLGGFVYDGDGNLYGLTCAHAQQYVLIKNGIFPNDDNRSLIDIAAVKVLGNIQQRCSINLKDEDGKKKPTELCKPTELYTKAPNEIVTEQAYKYGAGSNLTKGIICSADFTIRLGRAESDHLVLIDCLPGSDDGPYATEGDSGSITCITDVGKHAVKIKAVSMLCHGRYLIDDSELCVTFLLRKGLEKLQKSAGVELILPADKS